MASPTSSGAGDGETPRDPRGFTTPAAQLSGGTGRFDLSELPTKPSDVDAWYRAWVTRSVEEDMAQEQKARSRAADAHPRGADTRARGPGKGFSSSIPRNASGGVGGRRGSVKGSVDDRKDLRSSPRAGGSKEGSAPNEEGATASSLKAVGVGDAFERSKLKLSDAFGRMLTTIMKSRQDSLRHKFEAATRVVSRMSALDNPNDELNYLRYDAEVSRVLEYERRFAGTEWFLVLLQHIVELGEEPSAATRELLLLLKKQLEEGTPLDEAELMNLVEETPIQVIEDRGVQRVFAFLRRYLGVSLAVWDELFERLGLPAPVEVQNQLQHYEIKELAKRHKFLSKRIRRGGKGTQEGGGGASAGDEAEEGGSAKQEDAMSTEPAPVTL